MQEFSKAYRNIEVWIKFARLCLYFQLHNCLLPQIRANILHLVNCCTFAQKKKKSKLILEEHDQFKNIFKAPAVIVIDGDGR